MFNHLNRMFWKALTPDLVLDRSVAQTTVAVPPEVDLKPGVLLALGGLANLKSLQHVALTRLRVELHDADRLDPVALRTAGVPGVMSLSDGIFHLLVGLQVKRP